MSRVHRPHGRTVDLHGALRDGVPAEVGDGALATRAPHGPRPIGVGHQRVDGCCEAPVVASAVGGIPEVVVDGVTGLLVPYDTEDPASLEAGLAEAINALVAEPERARAMGLAGRERAIADFGWDAIAQRTLEVYRAAMGAMAA